MSQRVEKETSESQLSELGIALKSLQNSAKQLLVLSDENEAEPATSLSKKRAPSLLSQLTRGIANCNPVATEASEKLEAGLSDDAPAKAALTGVVEALDVYDFSNAELHLKEANILLG